MNDTVTIISFGKTKDDIENADALPPKARNIFDSATRMESHGFQEMNGYIGRQAIWSCAGYWTGKGSTPATRGKFHITSMGNGEQLYIE